VKTGRNDPCHCGSGKKYKLCHLPLEEAERRATAAEAPNSALPALPPGQDLEKTVLTLRELLSTGDEQQKAKVGRYLARAELLLAYVNRRPELEAAAQGLEVHQQELADLSKDKAAYHDRIEAVFAEDRFVSLRFPVEDLQRAFDQAGSPLNIPKEEMKEHLRRLVLLLSTKEYRIEAAVKLFLTLPDYIAEGRHLDACLVLNCARMTSDDPEEINPFLMQMFVHGYHAWTAAKQARLGA
jgi:hypothetical protein